MNSAPQLIGLLIGSERFEYIEALDNSMLLG